MLRVVTVVFPQTRSVAADVVSAVEKLASGLQSDAEDSQMGACTTFLHCHSVQQCLTAL